MNVLQRIFLLIAALIWSGSAFAWGPHWDITRAGIDVLATDHVIRMQLGSELDALTNYCWIPDFKRLPFRGGDQDFYCDDFLLFPGVTKHIDHICPEVRQTYEPYFQRALQALRTESPANAARWIGSLLHFVQDSGSPPHAAQIRGDIHIKMENWLAASNIAISGYAPKLLGTNDLDAVRGLVSRMNELIGFSRPRGVKLRTHVLLSNRRAVAPVALECANECARVSADVLHTLATLAAENPAAGFEVSGKIQAAPAITDARFPVRLLIHGTNVSTLADASGIFRLRGVPSGVHRISIVQPGNEVMETNLSVTRTVTNLVFTLRPSGDLVRNGNFKLRWIATNAPDCWTKLGSSWEGEVLALQPGTRYRVHTDFPTNSTADVLVRWTAQQPFVIPKPMKVPRYETQRLTIEQPDFVLKAGTNAALMMLTIRSKTDPTNSIRRVSVTPVFE